MNYGKCACKGNFLDRFIQPAILTALYDGPLHGFAVLNKMKDNGLTGEGNVDPTGLYRTLKKMEEAGLLTADAVRDKKIKRVYAITQEGKDCLVSWRETLEAYRDEIGGMIEKITEKTAQNANKGTCACAKGAGQK